MHQQEQVMSQASDWFATMAPRGGNAEAIAEASWTPFGVDEDAQVIYSPQGIEDTEHTMAEDLVEKASPRPSLTLEGSSPIGGDTMCSSPTASEELGSMLGISDSQPDAEVEQRIAALYVQQKAHAAREEYEEAGWVKEQIEALREEQKHKGSAEKVCMKSRVPEKPGLTGEIMATQEHDLLSGIDPAMQKQAEAAEVDELLDVMYPEAASKATMPDDDRPSARNRRRKGKACRVARTSNQSLCINGEVLHGEEAFVAQEKMDRANRLLARAMSSGVVQMGSGSDPSFRHGFLGSLSPTKSPAPGHSTGIRSAAALDKLNKLSPDIAIGSSRTMSPLKQRTPQPPQRRHDEMDQEQDPAAFFEQLMLQPTPSKKVAGSSNTTELNEIFS